MNDEEKKFADQHEALHAMHQHLTAEKARLAEYGMDCEYATMDCEYSDSAYTIHSMEDAYALVRASSAAALLSCELKDLRTLLIRLTDEEIIDQKKALITRVETALESELLTYPTLEEIE